MFYVYILQSLKDHKFYTGFTTDINRRFEEHNSGKVASTKSRTPLKLIYFEFCLNQTDALHREISQNYLREKIPKESIKEFPFGIVFHRVAEGFERDGNKEFINFLYIAKGSNGEVQSQSYRAFDAEFITPESFEDLLIRTENLKRKINNLILTLKSSGPKGYK